MYHYIYVQHMYASIYIPRSPRALSSSISFEPQLRHFSPVDMMNVASRLIFLLKEIHLLKLSEKNICQIYSPKTSLFYNKSFQL